MGVAPWWNTTYRYLQVAAVTDVQMIIDALYDELVTGLGWTCTLGGKTQTPTTFKSPARSDIASWTVKCTRQSATRISYECRDHMGMLMNPNTTDSRQDVEVAGNSVSIFSGLTHLCMNSERAAPECFWCALLDPWPEPIGIPEPFYACCQGPRDATGAINLGGYWNQVYIRLMSGVAYVATDRAVVHSPASSFLRQHMDGTYLVESFEVVDTTNGLWQGHVPQVILVADSLAWNAEITVPIGSASTGTFKVVGSFARYLGKIAFRKS
jgi:hypothetical protein